MGAQQSGGSGSDTESHKDDMLSTNDSEWGAVTITYKQGGPSVKGKITKCFDEGHLYRVITDNNQWFFYNDTVSYQMYVSWRFGPGSQLTPLGNAKAVLDGGWTVITTTVYPGFTEPFVEGIPNGFRSSMAAQPLSEDYHQKINDEADMKINVEMQSLQKLVRRSTDPERNLVSCLNQHVPYIDVNFLPQHTSLWRRHDPRQLHPTPWRRPTDFLPDHLKRELCLWREVSPRGIDAGQLGDNWFLCSVASLAEFPGKIKDIFSHPVSEDHARKERDIGAYRVTLNKHGWWHIVVIDDYLPVVGNKPCFAKNVEDPAQMWVPLLQKAYAKVHGSYSSISGGDPLHALQDLTGYPINRFDTEWEKANDDTVASDTMWQDLLLYCRERYLMIVNTPGMDNTTYADAQKEGKMKAFSERYQRAGLNVGHAYSVTNVREFPMHGLKLVQIRNPWGSGREWTGDWGDDSELWTDFPDVRESLKFQKAEDGTFWMPWEEVKRYFDGGGVCFTKFNWYDYRVCGSFETGFPTVALEINVDEPTKMIATLSQRDVRGANPDEVLDAEYAACMLAVSRNIENGRQQAHMNSTLNPVKPSPEFTYVYARDVAMEYTFLPEHCPYYVVPRVYNAGGSTDYILGLLSESRIGPRCRVNFREFDRQCRVFQNFPKFTPKFSEKLKSAPYQFKALKGAPVSREGTAFSS